jgi:hypothetical protein
MPLILEPLKLFTFHSSLSENAKAPPKQGFETIYAREVVA